MKSILKSLIILLFLPINTAQAQRSKFELGIEGGTHLFYFADAKSSHSKSYKRQPKLGNSSGLTFQWNSKKHFSFRTGISYDRKSFTTTSNYSDYHLGSSSHSRGIYHFDYLTLPLLARFTYGEKVHFFFNAGVFTGYLVNQREILTGSSSYIVAGESHYSAYATNTNNKDQYKRFDIGLIGGIGMGIPIGKHWYVSAEMRENWGLMDINDNPKSALPRTNTNSIAFLLGISYKLGFRE